MKNTASTQLAKRLGPNAQAKHLKRALSRFDEVDPFNPQLNVSGFVYKDSGYYAGALFITNSRMLAADAADGAATHVETHDEGNLYLVHGEPHVHTPFKSFVSRQVLDFSDDARVKRWMITPRVGGRVVVTFKHRCGEGDVGDVVSFHPAGFAFVKDHPKARVKVKDVLVQLCGGGGGGGGAWCTVEGAARVLPDLAREEVQSVTVALVGEGINSFAVWRGGVVMRALYCTLYSGEVQPPTEVAAMSTTLQGEVGVEEACVRVMEEDLVENEAFRAARGLQHVHEYGNYANEGRLLFLMDEDGNVLDRTVYELLPEDYATGRKERFTVEMQQQVREVVQRGGVITPEAVQEAIGLGSYRKRRFGKLVEASVKAMVAPTAPLQGPEVKKEDVVVLLTTGVPGCGKSFFAEALLARSEATWVRVNQDTMGTRKACEQAMKTALKKGQNVIVDRTNIDVWQRAQFVQLARNAGVREVHCVMLDIDPDVCKERITTRPDHPTVPAQRESARFVDNFLASFVPPMEEEGFVSVVVVRDSAEVDAVVARFA